MASILKDIRAAFGDVEPAPYTVVVQRGGYEERVYPARRWVCTPMSGPSRHELVTPMFRRLFSYISGRNEPNIRIDMTTPVVTSVEPLQDNENSRKMSRTTCKGGGKGGGEDYEGDITDNTSNTPSSTIASSSSSSSLAYTMSFLVPASHQQEPPTTADKRIFFEDRKKMSVFVRRFSGYLNDEVERRELAALRQAVTSNGDEKDVDFSRYYVAGYDPPFKLLGRRNEIWVVKKVWEEEEEVEEVMEKGTCGDFVFVKKEEEEEEEEELTVVNGVVKAEEVKKEAKEGKGKEEAAEEKENIDSEEEEKANAVVEKNEVAVEGKVIMMNQKTLKVEKSPLMEQNSVVVEANGVMGKANGEVEFVEKQ